MILLHGMTVETGTFETSSDVCFADAIDDKRIRAASSWVPQRVASGSLDERGYIDVRGDRRRTGRDG
jgi:hypothetical protein